MLKIEWSQVLVAVIAGAFLAGVPAYASFSSRISYLEGLIASLERSVEVCEQVSSDPDAPEQPDGAQRTDPPLLAPRSPDSLTTIIADLQRTHVRESFGEFAGQNFSAEDLARFESDAVPDVIADSLRRDARFLSTILGLKAADAADQQAILRAANRPLRRTWAEIGAVSREGQTEAGNRAERMIAAAVVALAQELLRLSEDAIRRLAVP